MRLRPLSSLRSQLVLAFALVSLASAAAAAGVTIAGSRDVVLQQAQDSAVSALRTGVERLAPDLRVAPDQRTLGLLIARLEQAPGVDGPVAASFGGRLLGAEEVPAAVVEKAGSPATALAQRVRIDGQPSLSVAVPVLAGGAPSGLVVYSLTPLSPQEAVIGGIVTGAAAGAVPIALAAVAVALLIAGGLVRPIERLRAGVEQVATGELGTQVIAADRGEVGELARAFNSMSRDLRAEHDQLRLLEERARRFTADVSHELRTPLAAMTAVAGALASEAPGLPDDTAEAALLVAQETDSLARLVEDLIEISRFDAGTAELRLDEIELSALVGRTLALRQWTDRVAVDVPKELRVVVDPRRLDVVLANLVGNAVRHAPGAVVSITARVDQNRLRLVVADDGPGIPPELRPRVFDRFVKGDPARGRSEGSGLGLSIARENVTLHGGTLAVEAGAGTVFAIELPLRPL
ncbi:sensor histidine kinase [Rathayibacter tanaceti]|uniref:histidine kinase n=2 Tax=Rathayibacter tanaceti TaxID=1671680 RepID=A0A166I840_9MICO|nr:HAMP domain-containing sensor histidine kinase [Rathayibacter tanaceti]KZX21781.1 Sensor histidine kinase MtrB [Rathayibacter tanaceti]QHC54495.1 HAMP domain-containing protein [Rathayibacter tanaceti]TCO35011.1 two-component system sensor histidine kinase MtrB [Rathayibacter tanaceti]